MDAVNGMAAAAADEARAKRISKAMYRARKKATAGSGQRIVAFDPHEVFEAAGWRCEQCGISTPVEARGRKADNAPCLHHTVSMRLDGDHVPANCECWCQRCKTPKPQERTDLNFNPARGWYGALDSGPVQSRVAHGWDREAALRWAA